MTSFLCFIIFIYTDDVIATIVSLCCDFVDKRFGKRFFWAFILSEFLIISLYNVGLTGYLLSTCITLAVVCLGDRWSEAHGGRGAVSFRRRSYRRWSGSMLLPYFTMYYSALLYSTMHHLALCYQTVPQIISSYSTLLYFVTLFCEGERGIVLWKDESPDVINCRLLP